MKRPHKESIHRTMASCSWGFPPINCDSFLLNCGWFLMNRDKFPGHYNYITDR